MTATDEAIRERLEQLYRGFFGTPCEAPVFASAPGRIELAGNHTDHQGGRTISAGLDRRIYALACPNGKNVCHVWMEGFGQADINLDNLDPVPSELNTSAALIRGMAAAYARDGGTPAGFNAVVISEIPVGGGVSSSAAFEVLIGALIRETAPTGWSTANSQPTGTPPVVILSEGRSPQSKDLSSRGDPSTAALRASAQDDKEGRELCAFRQNNEAFIQLALHGQFAEGVYFGKPTGAQDQLASAFGGIVALDFFTDPPQVTPVDANFAHSDFALVLIDSRCDHSRFTAQFNSVPADMKRVAGLFGCDRLVDVPLHNILDQFAETRTTVGDLAAMRALHFYNETRRVEQQTRKLQQGHIAEFVRLARESGSSSAMFLQNVSPTGDGLEQDQPAMVIQSLCATLLQTDGAWRIHGGGFGGCVLAFVPKEREPEFTSSLNQSLGYKACFPVAIDPQGLKTAR